METYLNLLRKALQGERSETERTGAGTIGVFQQQARFDLSKGFPIVTTKPTYWRGVVEELLWFIKGETNIRSLLQKKCSIWSSDALRHNLQTVISSGLMTQEEIDSAREKASKAKLVLMDNSLSLENRSEQYKELMISPNELLKRYETKILEDSDFAAKAADLGPVYGYQWRNFNGSGVDQILELEKSIKAGGASRRMIVSAWNPAQLSTMALPPCHLLIQAHVAPQSRKLTLAWYQRSCDTVLGIPFNIASYALMANLLAASHDLELGELVATFADMHIYLPHIPAAEEQLKREPKPLPTLKIINKRDSITEYTSDDFKLEGYEKHPRLENPTPMFGGFF